MKPVDLSDLLKKLAMLPVTRNVSEIRYNPDHDASYLTAVKMAFPTTRDASTPVGPHVSPMITELRIVADEKVIPGFIEFYDGFGWASFYIGTLGLDGYED